MSEDGCCFSWSTYKTKKKKAEADKKNIVKYCVKKDPKATVIIISNDTEDSSNMKFLIQFKIFL